MFNNSYKCSILTCTCCWTLPTLFMEETVFLHCIIMPPFFVFWPSVHGFISGLSVLFHWSIFQFLCQCHTFLTIVALYNSSLKTGSLSTLALFSFLKIVWPFRVFDVSIQTSKYYILVLWNIPQVIWQGLHWTCRLPWIV